jgi:hypothetical protein
LANYHLPHFVHVVIELPYTAQKAYALKEEVEEAMEQQQLLELQLAEAAIRAGLEMGIATISTVNNNLACTYDGGDCCLIVRISLTNELLNAGFEFSIMKITNT